jgi:uncharacterized protein
MVLHKDFSFTSKGEAIACDLHLPSDVKEPLPVVVSAAGFGGVKEMLLPEYAEALASAGIACLLFDYVGFGDSGGALRQCVDPAEQLVGFSGAIDALVADKRFDRTRIGVWGVSLSGGHTLTLAGTDKRVKTAAAIIPYINTPLNLADALRFFIPMLKDGISRLFGGAPKMIAVSGEPGDLAIMTSDGVTKWMEEMTNGVPTFRNEVTVSSLNNMRVYDTRKTASKIQIPILVLTAIDDQITPAKLKGVSSAKIVDFAGTHFGLFAEHRPETVRLLVEWFKEKL